MQRMKNWNLRHIGSGSSRDVYDLRNGYVLKIAKNSAGLAQNQEEYRISLMDVSGLFAKVSNVSYDFKYLIMRKARRIGSDRYIFRFFNVTNRREFMKLKEIRSIRDRYNLLWGDLLKVSSWGIIDGKVVIIDYGFTRKIRDIYY